MTGFLRSLLWVSLGLGVAGCAGPPAPIYGVPRHAPYHARFLIRDNLRVYSVSAAGMIVGGGPLGSNPGLGFNGHAGLSGLVFIDNPAPPGTFLWRFTPGVKLLDQTCTPISPEQVMGVADGPGDKSAMFIVYLDVNQQPVAPAKMVIWNRIHGNPSDCSGEDAAVE